MQIVIVGIARYMSVASICTAIAYPIIVAVCHPDNGGYIVFAVLMGLLALFCHRANISRLISRTENRLDFNKISRLGSKLRHKK